VDARQTMTKSPALDLATAANGMLMAVSVYSSNIGDPWSAAPSNVVLSFGLNISG
jgi:hypothetical protein